MFSLRAPRLCVSALSLLLVAAPAAAGDATRGAMLFAMAGGCGCHTTTDGPVGAGGRELPTPFGTFYGSNITPDRDTGIGAWTDDEIVAVIRDGRKRSGAIVAPVMPYYQYAGMADADVRDLVAYLRTLAPVSRQVPPAKVTLPLPRLAYRAWRWLYAPSLTPPATAPDEPLARGRYYVDHVAICGDCHTPRTRLGALDQSMYLAGTNDGPDGHPVPNITPDKATGIGKWAENHYVGLLRSGMLPNFDNVQGLMAEVIDGIGGGPGYKDLSESELRSLAKYLKTVPPVRHEVGD
jgi:mono/diheme cytochrome c family protein